jgi:hypothetical protein
MSAPLFLHAAGTGGMDPDRDADTADRLAVTGFLE